MKFICTVKYCLGIFFLRSFSPYTVPRHLPVRTPCWKELINVRYRINDQIGNAPSLGNNYPILTKF